MALVPDRVADGVVDRLVDDTGGNPLGILGDRPPPHRRPASGRRAAALRAARGRPAWGGVLAAAHRLVRTGLARRTAVRAQPLRVPPRRWRRAGPGRSWTFPPRWTRLRTTACWCVTARRSASAIRCCVPRCWPWRPRRNNGPPIAHWRMSSPPIHTRSRGPGTEPKPPPARTRSSRRTWYAQRTRAAPGRDTPPHRPRWSGPRCSPMMLR